MESTATYARKAQECMDLAKMIDVPYDDESSYLDREQARDHRSELFDEAFMSSMLAIASAVDDVFSLMERQGRNV